MRALSRNTSLTQEEKRLEIFEIMEPQLRLYWKKFKYNQGIIVNMIMVLLEMEYFTTDLVLKMFRGLYRNNGPEMYDRLTMLYEKMSELNGILIR